MHDLTATGGPADQVLEDGILQRVSPAMEVLWQWNSFDHMLWTEMVYDHSETEYAHLNSVAVDAQGNWIVSARAFSQILKLDGVTGEVIWRLGGVSNDFEFINDPYGPCGQHTASVLDNGTPIDIRQRAVVRPRVRRTRRAYSCGGVRIG